MKVTGSEKNNLLSSLLQFSIISLGRDGRDGRKGFAGARGMPGPKGIHYDLIRNRKDLPCFNRVKKQECKIRRTRNTLGTRAVCHECFYNAM